MRVRAILLASLIVVTTSGPASADNAPPPPMATDRPAVTNSSIVVPRGTVQAENGFAETASQGQRTVDGPETIVRFGVASKTELRLTAPDYFGQITGSPGSSGFGDLAIGAKQQLGPARGFDVSLIVSLSLPSGAGTTSSHGYDPSVQLPWSRALSPNWTTAGMLSVYWPTEEGRHNTTGETTFLLDRQLTKKWDAFVEYAGDFAQRGGPRHLAHFGTAYKLTLQQQIDLHVGIGLSSAAVDHFVGVGYSFRFSLLRRLSKEVIVERMLVRGTRNERANPPGMARGYGSGDVGQGAAMIRPTW